jgi:hypothetical protein
METKQIIIWNWRKKLNRAQNKQSKFEDCLNGRKAVNLFVFILILVKMIEN